LLDVRALAAPGCEGERRRGEERDERLARGGRRTRAGRQAPGPRRDPARAPERLRVPPIRAWRLA